MAAEVLCCGRQKGHCTLAACPSYSNIELTSIPTYFENIPRIAGMQTKYGG